MTGRQLTVGVIGHVDHGKTSLVKALTGTNTDRLAEEIERGLSIVLGYAFLEVDDLTIDLIDAPGHESFVKTMIAGATGIDAVLLVVAADEGIQPQTREHFDIARLLGIRRGVIVITKSDLVDAARLEQTIDKVRQFVEKTPLAQAEVVPASSADGDGLENITRALSTLAEDDIPRPRGGSFYMPLDRVFTIEGFGTVATGTLRDGNIGTGSEVEIMPTGIRAAVRELQVHSRTVESATPGQRVAVNLRGVKREQLRRGQTLCSPGSIRPSDSLLCSLEVLDGLPRLPRRNELVRMLFGTTDVIAKIRTIDDKPLGGGTGVFVRLHLQEAVLASKGDAFILRNCSPVLTIGGGTVLETSDYLRDVSKDDLAICLEQLHNGTTEEQLAAYVSATACGGISFHDLSQRLKTDEDRTNDLLNAAGCMVIEDIVLGKEAMDSLQGISIDRLRCFHEEHPDDSGQSLEDFRASLLQTSPLPVVEAALKMLVESGDIIIDGASIRLAEFDLQAGLSEEERALIDSIETVFREGGASTPSIEDVVGLDPGRRNAYQYLKEQGRLITVTNSASRKQFVFHSDTIERIKKDLAREFPAPKKFTVADMRSLADSSRKYVVPLLEYFDRKRLTIRQGDYRVITQALTPPD